MIRRALKRVLPVVVADMRTCEGCRHWDLAAGQREMAKNPHFMAVTQAVSPDRLGQSVFRPRLPGESDEAYRAAHDAARAELERLERGIQWQDLGLCNARDEIRWKKDRCEKWALPTLRTWLERSP